MTPRPGSRKAQVYASFTKDGEAIAFATGTGLGLKLGTVKSWIGTWAKGAPQGDIVKNKVRSATKPTITVTWDPDRTAYLIVEGPEVSEVRWADTGHYQYIINKFLMK